MPDQIDDIMTGLRDHVEIPPGFLAERILHAMDIEAQQNSSFYLRLNHLREYDIEVPASHLISIQEKLFTPAKPRAGLLASIARYSVAAAAITILLTVGWLFSRKDTLPSPEKKDIVNQTNESAKQAIPPGDPVYIQKDPAALVKAGTIKNKEFFRKLLFKKAAYSDKIMPVGKNMVSLEDNDILYTIITCNYKMLAPYLEPNAPKMVVNVDQYSSVTINGKMIEFMKLMYKTRRNDKPTAKAKRAKASLGKWKKKDENYFNDSSKTALDIMDLGEFLMEKN